MSDTAVVGVILGILGVLSGTGYWGYRQFKKEAPIKKRDADIAAAGANVQMAIDNAAAALAYSQSLAKDLEAEREARQNLSGRFEGLEKHIRELNGTIGSLRDSVRIFSVAWDDLDRRWQVLRLSEHAPTRPHIHIE